MRIMGIFSSTSVGLEIDNHEIRVVELSGSSKSSKLQSFGKISLPEEVIKDGMILKPDIIAEKLTFLWKTHRISNREVILGVSNQAVIIRTAQFPKVPLDKLENLVRFQAQEFLPMPLHTAILDFLVIREIQNLDGDFYEVMLVAGQKSMLDGFITALNFAKLIPKDIGVSSLAQVRMIPDRYINKTIAMVNITKSQTNLLFVQTGMPRFSRYIPIVFGNKATDVKQTTLLISEIRSSVEYYHAQNSSIEVDYVMVTGWGSMLPGFIEQLENSLQIPVEIDSILLDKKIGVASILKDAMNNINETEFALPICLALHGMEVKL